MAAIRQVMDDQTAAWNRGDIEGFMQGYWNSPELKFVSGDNVTKGWQPTLDRTNTRVTFQKPLAERQTQQMRIGRMATSHRMRHQCSHPAAVPPMHLARIPQMDRVDRPEGRRNASETADSFLHPSRPSGFGYLAHCKT